MARFLPEWFPPSGEVERPTASEINDLATNEQTVTVAGYNEPVQFVYGEQQLSGAILTVPTVHNNNLVYAVALCRSGSRKFGGITGLLINGADQAYSNTINANPTTFTRDGYQFRVYNGTQTAPDSTLKAIFGAEFNDVFEETAYVVITVPSSAANDFNFASSIIWTVRGRQCFDPRNNTWAWTENPSLHLYDFATCQKYGLARDVIGIAECADWNDSLYSGLPRARTGLVINEALEEYQIMDLLSTYAECLWSYEGDAIRVIADAPVDTPADTITKSQIRDGTFDIRGSDQSNVPTALSVIFSDRSRPAEWGSIPAHVQSPDHEVFGSISTQSDVQLLGVYRRVEAERRAWSRFMRLQVPGKISFQLFDDGIKYQLGDVLRIPDYMGVRSLMIRITAQVEPVDIGVYQIHGEVYKSDFYPGGLAGAVVPEGGVLFSPSGKVYAGFRHIAGLKGLPVFGSSDSGIKPASGNVPSGSISATLLTAGAHTGSTDVVNAQRTYSWTPGVPAQNDPQVYNATGAHSEGAHSHYVNISLPLIDTVETIGRSVFAAMERTNDPTIHRMTGLCFLSVSALPQHGVVEDDSGIGLLLAFGDEEGIKAATSRVSFQSSEDGYHRHTEQLPPVAYDEAYLKKPSTTIAAYHYTSSYDGLHSHAVSVDVDRSLNSVKIAVNRFVSESIIPKGGIIGFIGESIPDGWVLCDGTRGAPNLMGSFLEISSSMEAGEWNGKTSSAKITVAGSSSNAGQHSHSFFNWSGRFAVERGSSHSSVTGSHSHSVQVSGGGSRTFNYTPERFEMKFIQYIGE